MITLDMTLASKGSGVMKEIATSENEAAATVCRCTVKELQHI
jgi:hypothetical protein